MANDEASIEFLYELLEPIGRISARKMFGGHGVYCNGVMIGLVAEQLLYLKVDEQTKPLFGAVGCEPFVYQSKTKQVAMSYWSIPDDAMESTEQMLPWAKLAYAAALRKEKKVTSKKKT